MLTNYESEYYSRQLNLPEFGIHAQHKLKKSSVFIAGAGGLGCPVLLYLAGAGIGKITIADGDDVQLNNLHRQVIYNVDDIGKKKAEVAANKISRLNPNISINPVACYVNNENIELLINNNDIVIDATDNFETRILIGHYTEKLRIPLVFAAISGYEGQLSVFNYNGGPAFRHLYPAESSVNMINDCSANGVLGLFPGIMGCLQAAEALKILTGMGTVMKNKLLIINLLTLEKREFIIKQQDINKDSGINNHNTINTMIGEINASELKERMGSVYLLDVREPYEYSSYNIGGTLIPMREIPDRVPEIPNDKDIVVICESGVRSLHVAHYISKIYPETNVFNLRGGLLAWRR